MKAKLVVTVISDPLCPWCYIGTRRLLRALALLADEFDFDPTSDLDFKPYGLFPSALTERPKLEFYVQRYGAGVARMRDTLAAEAPDIAFNFSPEATLGPSLEAHRLVALTPRPLRLQLMLRLFKAYHEDGLSLARSSTLEACARGIVDVARLATDEGRQELQAELQRSKETIEASPFAGGGVPFFVFTVVDVQTEKDASVCFAGAQSELYITQVLKRARTRASAVDAALL